MTKKSLVVILILSVSAWYISRYIGTLFDVFILNHFAIDIFGSSCLPTGYPLFYCADNAFILALIGSINIISWFVVIWGIWKMLPKLFKKE